MRASSISILFFALLQTAASPVGGQELSQEQLDTQLANWSELGWSDYDFVFARSCFCTENYRRPGLVQVRAGVIAGVQDPSTRLPLDPELYLTIEQLFGALQSGIDDNAEMISVTFDENAFYPTNMYIDTSLLIADEEVGYSAENATNQLSMVGCDFENPRPCAGDFIDQLAAAVRNNDQSHEYDFDSNGEVNARDLVHYVEKELDTFIGDSNLDGEFNSADIVHVMRIAEYEDEVSGNSGWVSGDWNGNGDFESDDWVFALSKGNYEQGPRTMARAVPEPNASCGLMISAVLVFGARRRACKNPLLSLG